MTDETTAEDEIDDDEPDDETPTAEHESDKERVDRELIEFLNEVRVVLPGVQVLFAFLLTVPFTGAFAKIDGGERLAYIVAFFFTALAAVLMITPTPLHRLQFRQGDKEGFLRTSNQLGPRRHRVPRASRWSRSCGSWPSCCSRPASRR